MKHLLIISMLIAGFHKLSAQSAPAIDPILSPKQAAFLLTDSIKKAFNITFPIYRVYQYADKSGHYFCVLTESRDVINEKDTFNFKIKAINLRSDIGKLTKTWELNDFIIKSEHEENSIWFWTKFTEFKDYDNDGLADPIIIYGTTGMNGYGDGRIKILIFYKGQKVAIRHQNGELDYERETQVDKAFYDLPAALQEAVKQKMEIMVKNNNAIFPYGWQTAMKNKKVVFNERKK